VAVVMADTTEVADAITAVVAVGPSVQELLA
jgi:hypothetical protein